MKAFYCDSFVLPLPEGHRFPMEKYRLLRERVAAAVNPPIELCLPPAADDRLLLLAHDEDYLQRVCTGMLAARDVRALGFPWSAQLVERSRRSTGATLAACQAALRDGAAANLAGGTHHAFRHRPEGFCVFNDSAVAAYWLRHNGLVQRVLVVDTDVHQGNGSAAILRNEDWAYTFSIHCQDNFPFRKEHSNLDVELPRGTGDAAYLAALAGGLEQAATESDPEFIVYLAGSDGYRADRYGKLALTKSGLAQRDDLVFSQAAALGVPVVISMAGGYAREVSDTVDIHFQSVRRAARYAQHWAGARRQEQDKRA
jgi:acetoin utilization deacetylase AcuC-like enzyme